MFFKEEDVNLCRQDDMITFVRVINSVFFGRDFCEKVRDKFGQSDLLFHWETTVK